MPELQRAVRDLRCDHILPRGIWDACFMCRVYRGVLLHWGQRGSDRVQPGLLVWREQQLSDAERVRHREILRGRGDGVHRLPRGDVRVIRELGHCRVHRDVYDRALLHRGFYGPCRVPCGNVWFHNGAADGRVQRGLHCWLRLRDRVQQPDIRDVWGGLRMPRGFRRRRTMHMQRGVFELVNDFSELRWNDLDVRDMRGWRLLRRRQRARCGLHMR